ncbi:MAG: phosphate/phosphite/phosphonate ABC transporter substrate-binding protein [Woeseiaceae bacterium]|nr:phosphate/phosphite/phosphonate ABC transporter substrate-binding protein [Woeseiaceae bacterium]
MLSSTTVKQFLRTLFCLILVTQIASAYSADDDNVYVLARAPQLSPLQLVKTWQPLVDYLAAETQSRIELKVYDERSDFESDLVEGTPDFIFGNPGYFVVANELHGFVPLVRSDKSRLKGIIVTRKDSPIGTIEDLKHQAIAFPSPHAMAASLYVQALLSSKDIPFTPHYFRTHDNVYRHVANGGFAAGGGVYRTLNLESAALKDTLRVLYETPGIAPHPLSANPDVPIALRSAVTTAILNLTNTEQGRALLASVKMEQPVAADMERDYIPVRDISLRMYHYLLQRQQ